VARSPPDERPRGDRTTDEGWSKYFKDIGDTTLAVEPARSTRSSQASNETKSDYRSSQWPSVPGIALGVLDEPHPLNRVQVGSPSTELFPSKEGGLLHQSQMAKISSVDSLSIVSEDDDQDPTECQTSQIIICLELMTVESRGANLIIKTKSILRDCDATISTQI
jgi:hypothetical protein